MPSNPQPLVGTSYACVTSDAEAYTGVAGSGGSDQYPDTCPATLLWSYDNDGRKTTETGHEKTKAGCYDPTETWATNSYDAENHLIGNQFLRGFDVTPTTNTLAWGPNGKVRYVTEGPTGGTTLKYTVHWDGDTMLFVTDANGNLVQTNVELLGTVMYQPGYPQYTSLYVDDRDVAGVSVGAHSDGTYTETQQTSSGGWEPINAGFSRTGKYSIAIVTSGNGLGGGGTGLFPAKRTDGYEFPGGATIQGVRAFDGVQWMTPDAYKGDVHDPMSQRSYMWNDNNPVAYSDPSGYESGQISMTCSLNSCQDMSPPSDHVFIKVEVTGPGFAQSLTVTGDGKVFHGQGVGGTASSSTAKAMNSIQRGAPATGGLVKSLFGISLGFGVVAPNKGSKPSDVIGGASNGASVVVGPGAVGGGAGTFSNQSGSAFEYIFGTTGVSASSTVSTQIAGPGTKKPKRKN